MNYFVTGIGTDVGKTVVSAVLTQALAADYWKPIQCGLPRDTEKVSALVTHPQCKFYQESVFLREAASPHQAAAKEGIKLSLKDLVAPETSRDLIIEGAGGLMVPLNQDELMLDLARKFADEVILVVSLYLGCINHSLLTLDVLKRHRIPLKGLVFNGESNPYSEDIILKYGDTRKLLHLPPANAINQEIIKQWAQNLMKQWA